MDRERHPPQTGEAKTIMNPICIRSRSSALGIAQVDEGKRETAAELRRAVLVSVEVHGMSIRETGKRFGLTDRTVLDLLLEAEHEDRRRAMRLAFDNGRRSALPPFTTAKRAA
jgi:hypothetical protein